MESNEPPTPDTPATRATTQPRQLEKYRLIEEVGQGGMAVVYRGLDTTLNREVAVKILHPHLADHDESRQRFQREAHAVAKLRHANILEIYDYSGLESPDSFIVTEFIHGQTLRAFLARNAISHPEIAALLVAEVCAALAHAHSLGVLHRDIKPENIMIRQDGRVKLTDFGIAQIIDVQRLTVTGQLLGSPAYMAPELVVGKPVDFRSDIFSVGTLAYQLATGRLPFEGRNPHEVLKRIADGRFTPANVANQLVGDKLARIVATAMAHKPDDRYAEIGALHRDLLGFLGDVGIDDPQAELSRYFSDPKIYSQQLQERVVERLTERGKQLLAAKDTPQALQYFDRVLSADPRNTTVLGILDHVARRRRTVRVVSILALIGLLSGGAYWLSRRWPEVFRGRTAVSELAPAKRRASRQAKSVYPAAIPDAAASGDVDRMAASPAVRADRMRADDLGAAAAPVAARRRRRVPRSALRKSAGPRVSGLAAQRRVEIVPSPKAMAIWLNAKRLGAYGPALRYVTLPPGEVRLVFRNDNCCFEKVLIIGPDESPESLRVKLPWKPGRVQVQVEPPNPSAEVLVGNLVGRPGQSFEVPIPSYSADGRTQVELKVIGPGRFLHTESVTVRANATSRVRVKIRAGAEN